MAAAHSPTQTRQSDSATWTLVVVSVSTFMLILDITVVNVALPDIRRTFDSSFSALQWILDSYALGLAAVLLAAGSLADRIGRKKVFDAGQIIFVLASLVCGLAPNDLTLILARFVQGLGGAILFAVGPALLGHEFRGKARGMAFGVFGAVLGLAIAFGPLIGGGLTESLGWRWIFLINVPLSIAALAVGYLKMRESRSDTPPPLDWPGMAAFSGGLFFLVLGFLRGQEDGWGSGRVVIFFIISVLFLLVFATLQVGRPGQAMFDLTLFNNRTFNGLSVVTAVHSVSLMPAIFLLIAYMQNMLGHSALASGVRFLPLTLVVFVAAALTGAVVAKLQPSVLMGASQLCVAGGALAMLMVDLDSGWTALIPAMVLFGLGLGVYNPPRAAFSIAVTTPDKAGMASGINETFQQAGFAIGIAAIGAFYQNRVTASFAEDEAVRTALGDKAIETGGAIAAGGPSVLPEETPAALREVAGSAVLSGLHNAMVVTAILSGISAVIAFLTMRRSDLDVNALETPGIPTEQVARGKSLPPIPRY